MIKVGRALVRVMVLNRRSSEVKCSMAITKEDNVAPTRATGPCQNHHPRIHPWQAKGTRGTLHTSLRLLHAP